MGVVAAAVTALSAKFAATKLGVFLAANVFAARLATSLAVSVLQAALQRKRGGAAQGRPAGIRTTQTQTGGTNPEAFVLGRYATEGQLVAPPMSFGSIEGIPNAWLTYVIELGGIPGQQLARLIIDGEYADFWGPDTEFGTPIRGRFSDYAWIRYHNGTQTAVDPFLANRYWNYPLRPWSNDMVGTGICYAIVTFRYNPEIFNGFPKVRFEMFGIPLYDPRKDSSVGGTGPHRWADRSTWETTQNAGVQVYNILRGIDLGGGVVWGGDADAEDLPLDVWWAQMNVCDTWIYPDELGGGFENQYRASFEVFVDDEPATVLEEILAASSGTLAENGGVWKVRFGPPGLPVHFMTDDDVIITESEEHTPFSGESFNGVQASYPDPASLWEPRDAPPRVNAAMLAEDGGSPRNASLDLNACPYPLQVQRIMRAYVEEERRFRRHVLSLPAEAVPLEGLDVVSWTSERHGYDAKLFEVASHVDPLVTGTPRLTLRERDPSDYSWQQGFELAVPLPAPGAAPLLPQLVVGFAVTAVSIDDGDDVPARPAIRVAWTPVAEDVRGIQFEVETAAGDPVTSPATTNVAAGAFLIIEGLLPDTAYRVRARFVVSRPTTWTDFVAVTTLDVRIRADDLDTLSMGAAGLRIFGGTLQSDNYETGVAGWMINRTGEMELQNLVARDWIKEGAVSDGVHIVSAVESIVGHTVAGTQIWAGEVGEIQAGSVRHLLFSGEFRYAGDQPINSSFNGSTFTITFRRYLPTFIIDYRGLDTGVWTGWRRAYTSPVIDSPVFQSTEFVTHLIGNFTQTQVVFSATAGFFDYVQGGYASIPAGNYPQATLRNWGLSARSVIK